MYELLGVFGSVDFYAILCLFVCLIFCQGIIVGVVTFSEEFMKNPNKNFSDFCFQENGVNVFLPISSATQNQNPYVLYMKHKKTEWSEEGRGQDRDLEDQETVG